MKRIIGLLGVMMWVLSACRSPGILQNVKQADMFRERYINKPFYTAMVLRPYRYEDEYLIDLTGKITETDFEMFRVPLTVPLGTPIMLTGVDAKHVLARIPTQTKLFRISVQTQQGTAEELRRELALLVSKDHPLEDVRAEFRRTVEQQDITRGMSRREVYMSWGLPDKVTGIPMASGFFEQWSYFDKHMHLFMENGMVTNWQHF